MIADERTLETLDFAAIRDRVVSYARTQRGRTYAQALAPVVDFDRVQWEQSATNEVRTLVASVDLHVMSAIDPDEAARAAAMGTTLAAADVRAVADAAAAAAAAYNKTREAPSDVLERVTRAYQPLKELVRTITDAIDERGTVQDRASAALARIRRSIHHAQNEARERVTALLRSSKYSRAIQDNVVTIREGRFVVPIKAEFSGEVPGIVHDTSSSGQTLFVEPLAALDSNNRLRTLRIEEEREIARILTELSRLVGTNAVQIDANIEMLAQIDVLVAKAQVARSMNAVMPQLVREPMLDVEDGRHPLLGDRAVPQSLRIDDERRLIVISGPNMGGKTVALKMVGLFVAMTYAGMQIPAREGTTLGCFTRIFTDIGDEQSIAENASTFSAHLKRMREILASADERTLVLVDEIGGGTEPTSGAALAVAMLEALLQVRASGIVTTHATELKLFASGTPGVSNASVRFDPQTFAPTYHLDIGTPGQSLAFPLAQALGIPHALLERAESLLSTRERDYETALAELASVNAELQTQREALEREHRHVARLEQNARERVAAFERERREFAEKAEARMAEALRSFSEELARRAEEGRQRPRVTAGQSALLQRTLDEMRRDLRIKPQRTEETSGPQRFERDQKVRVLSFDQDATVIADNGDTLLVAIGPMKTVVQKSDVRARGVGGGAKEQRKTPRTQAHSGEARLEASTRTMGELDVRGKRYIEAEPLVDQWIDEAVLAGNSPLRVIHGKGTGMLGRGLQEFLRSHPNVKNVRYGDENEGGGGVTIFELR